MTSGASDNIDGISSWFPYRTPYAEDMAVSLSEGKAPRPACTKLSYEQMLDGVGTSAFQHRANVRFWRITDPRTMDRTVAGVISAG